MTQPVTEKPTDLSLKALRAALVNAWVKWRYLGTVPKEKVDV